MTALRIVQQLTVAGCHECPFADSDGSGYDCSLGGERRLVYAFSDENAPKRPDWCPLVAAGEVVVKAAT